MARTNPEITNEEGLIYHSWCAKHGVIPDDPENAAFVAKYFQETWREDVTESNLDAAFPLIKDRLNFYAPNQANFIKLFASLTAEEQKIFGDWRGERGLKDSYQNAVAILSWLKAHSFKVTQANLQLAVGQNKVYPYLEWDDSARPRYENPRQHKDDRKPAPPVNEPLWKKLRREREERESASPTSAQQTGPVDAWETLCNQLLNFGTHGQQAAMRAEFDRGISQGKSFREIYTQLNALKTSYQRLVPAGRF